MSASTRNKHSKLEHDKLDISKDEFDRIREALSKEEFRKLFFEYVEEIQDPENRKIYEQEITQLEKERGVNVTFIHPKPGFVIKSTVDGELKCFINVASCPEIAPPHSDVAEDPETGSKGLTWSIPMAQTAARDDFDNNKKHCKVYDVVFHPDALYLAERNPQFRKCLIDTALDAVERAYEVRLDRANLKYPKLDYKGISRPTVIRKLATNPSEEEREPHPLEHLYPQKPDEGSGQPKLLPLKKQMTPQPQFTQPNYSIKHSHDVDLAEYTDELDAKLHKTVPSALVVEIELPLLSSAADCQLDVTAKSIYLLSERHGAKYKLKLDLPYTVDDKAGNARFDTDQRRLCITLPVIRSSSKQQRDMHDALRHYSREDSGVELHSNSESPVEEEEEEGDNEADGDGELSDSAEERTKEAASDASTTATPTSTPVHTPRAFLKSSVHYQLPARFDCNALDKMLAFVLHVANVQPDSLLTNQKERSLHLQFATMGSGYYPTHYAFYVELPRDAKLLIESAEAEAWDNNVVLRLSLNAPSLNLSSYLAGLDGNDLKEYDVNGQYRSKRSKKQTSTQSLDVSIERKEEERALEITIRPQRACTTEDDEEEQLDQQQSQKKLSKKQRKRNKKERERSLSESACEDIKAYRQQQQKSPLTESPEDSSPERNEAAGGGAKGGAAASSKPIQRKQRSYSECNDSSGSYRGILKRFSRYGGPTRPSMSDSCSSIDADDYSSSYCCSQSISQSFGGIPEEHDDDCLSESCKKTVRFNDQIMKQVFRLDSSILGQRKKNQKRRDCKLRAQQRRVSEGDSADYEESHDGLKTAANEQYFKQPNPNHGDHEDDKKMPLHDSGLDLAGNNNNNNNNSNSNNNEAKRNNKPRAQHDDHHHDAKNSMMFEMDDDM